MAALRCTGIGAMRDGGTRMTELSILIDDDVTTQAEQDPVYNPAMIQRLHQSIEHAKQGKYVVKTMEELRRMEDE
jgi:hypothetical protein